MTTYAVCPRCGDLHPVNATFNETAYAVYRATRDLFPRGSRLDINDCADAAHVSYKTAYKYITQLANAGLVDRVPMGKLNWYRVPMGNNGSERRTDPCIAGEGHDEKRTEYATITTPRTKRNSSALTPVV